MTNRRRDFDSLGHSAEGVAHAVCQLFQPVGSWNAHLDSWVDGSKYGICEYLVPTSIVVGCASGTLESIMRLKGEVLVARFGYATVHNVQALLGIACSVAVHADSLPRQTRMYIPSTVHRSDPARKPRKPEFNGDSPNGRYFAN